MSRCPTPEELELFSARESFPAQAPAIKHPVRDGAECREWLEDFRASEDILPGVPRALERTDRDGRVSPRGSPRGGPGTARLALTREVPRPLSRYRVRRRVGAGDTGIIYEAEQRNPRRTAALKVIAPRLLRGGPIAARPAGPVLAEASPEGSGDRGL